MSFVVDAVYENGALKSASSLPLKEHQRVRVTVQEEPAGPKHELTYGLIGWTGDAEVVRRIALDPEFAVQNSP